MLGGPEMEETFDSWLKQLLDSHDVDGEVFGEYISGTLNTIEDPTGDEITENLSDILSGCVVIILCSLCQMHIHIVCPDLGR